MASMRRTLSPVPKPGTRMNGEACSVASPLSRSSSSSPSIQSSGLSYSSINPLEYALYKIHGFVLGFFSHRASRPLERSKSKGQVWKRALLYFSLCFMVGVFVGLTPFNTMNFSSNLMSKRQTLFLDMIPSKANNKGQDFNVGTPLSVVGSDPENTMPLPEKWNVANESLRLLHEGKPEQTVGTTEERAVAYLPREDPILHTPKPLIIVTPTSARPMQAYYINRLAQTLKLVRPPLLWIIVEMTFQSAETADILRRTGVMYRHLVCNKNVTEMMDRKVHLRNVALVHIETHHLDGIVYLADDNNVYTVDLFEQLRQIRRFGTLRVAKLFASHRGMNLGGPVCNGTEVIGWNTNERNRRFYADLSGFAFNSTILWDSKRWHRPTLEPIRQLDNMKERFQVSAFIEQIVEDESQMEGLPQGCSTLMVWHLPLESSFQLYPRQWVTSRYLESRGPVIHNGV